MKNKKIKFWSSSLWILVLAIYLISITWNKWGDIVSFDTSREILVPYLISKGLILYNNIEYNYGPIVPYLFTMIINVFGLKLALFYSVGMLNAFIYLIILYLISRQYLNYKQSILVCCLFLSQLVFFNSGMFSYIFPYSYAAVIGSTILAFNCFFLVLLLKKPNNLFFLTASGLCVSILFLVKQDFFINGLISIFIALICIALSKVGKRKEESKAISIMEKVRMGLKEFVCVFPWRSAFVIVSIIFCFCITSLMIMFNYFEAKSIYNSFFALDLLHQSHVKIFLEKECKSTLTIQNMRELVFFAVLNMFVAMISICLTYFALGEMRKRKTFKSRMILVFIAFSILLFSLVIKIGDTSLLIIIISMAFEYSKYYYSGINLWILFFIIILISRARFNKDYFLLFLLFIALINNLRMFFNMQLELYAFYYLPFSIILFVYFLCRFLPKYLFVLFKLNRQLSLKSSYLFIICTIIVFLLVTTGVYAGKNIKIKTLLGESYINKYNYLTFMNYKKMYSMISAYSGEKDRVLFYPTANLMYIMSNRLPGSKYFNLLPATIYTKVQEQESIQEIENLKPRYIYILDDRYDLYNLPYFGCTDYNERLMQFIKLHYTNSGFIETSLDNETKKITVYHYNGH